MDKNNKSKIPLFLFVISWILFCFFSFTQKDLNLTLYNYPIIKDILIWLQNIGYFQRPINTLIFILLSIILFSIYLEIILKKIYLPSLNQVKKTIIILLLFGIFSYPAFSHDIFNYLFNAKMVLVYKDNPHINTASNFLFDPWTRFMHNIHTPAPYAYGWTLISLLPVLFTLSNFTLSFWSMKLFISLFFIGEAYLIYKITNNSLKKTLIFLLNPLLLIETFIIGHNDSIMMFLALLSIYFLEVSNLSKVKKNIAALLAFTLSVLIKYATIVLLPIYFLKKIYKKIDFYLWSGVALFAILFTRPGQFHSWYFHWSFVFLILSKKSWANWLAIIISIGGLIRYAPYVYFGNWDYPVPILRWILLFIPFLTLLSKKTRNIFSQ